MIGDGSAGCRGQVIRPELRTAIAELGPGLSDNKILELFEAASSPQGGVEQREELLELIARRRPELRTFDARRIAGL